MTMYTPTLKSLLLEAPDGHIDTSLLPLIEAWSEPPKASEILEVINKMIYSGLASGFALTICQGLYEEAKALSESK